MDYLSELNPAQREAVEQMEGPQLVIAGAGSGKTRVLTYKIAYLLEHNIPANNILALTFTNKAAREMKARIIDLVGQDVAGCLWMGTFHAICARILRKHATILGYTSDYSIYDTTDTKSVLKHIVQDLGLDEKSYKPATLYARISMAKNQLLSPNDYGANRDYQMRDRFDHVPEMARIYAEYNRRLKASNAMDFDDLLFLTEKLLRTQTEVAEYYQSVFQYMLVDEYQDTNRCQYMILKRLCAGNNNLCVVGDDAQSIYSFRGATIDNILNFKKDFSESKVFKLERNYRSSQTIVEAANSLIHRNKGQIPKQIYSERSVGERLRLLAHITDKDEAKSVAREIKNLISTDRGTSERPAFNYDDVAVLYRTNAQSRVLEDELRTLNLPYRIYGGTGFYQRKEIKDALGYFRLAINSSDSEALMRIINYPTRGIGETTVQKVREAAKIAAVEPFQVVADPIAYNLDVAASTAEKLKAFADLIRSFAQAATQMDAYEFAEDVLRRSGMIADAQADTSPEGKARWENLEEMKVGIHEFVEEQLQQDSPTDIASFLAQVSLLTDQDEKLDDNTPRVTLMTVHAAKGLEFRIVFVVGLEESLFPSAFSQTPKEIEEERRLLYVAITRAMDLCYISSASQRFRNGTTMASSPSRFIREIDNKCVIRWDGLPSHATKSTSLLDAPRSAKSMPVVSSNMKRTTGLQQKQERQMFRSPWKKNDRVNHKVFGPGTVLDVYRENDNDKIEIQFDAVGKKTLLLSYAKLERIQ